MVRDIQQCDDGRLGYVRESLGTTLDTENDSDVVLGRGRARSPPGDRLAGLRGSRELHDGGITRSAFSEWRADAAFADGVSAILADDMGGGEGDAGELLQRSPRSTDYGVPLYGEFGGSKGILHEGRELDRVWCSQRIREGSPPRAGQEERSNRDSNRPPRSIKHVRRITRKAFWHLRRSRELLEAVQWDHSSTESEESY